LVVSSPALLLSLLLPRQPLSSSSSLISPPFFCSTTTAITPAAVAFTLPIPPPLPLAPFRPSNQYQYMSPLLASPLSHHLP
jgi:hypothetical protein